nr:thyrotropin-releasing hormone receptor-like [Lytechinus pictus]
MSFVNTTTPTAQTDVVSELVTLFYFETTNVVSNGGISLLPTVSYKHRIIVSALLLFVSLLGMAGNFLVILSVMVSKKLQTPTNVLVVSLAVADLMTCLIIPLQVVMLLSQSDWPLPEVVCKGIVYMSYAAICCSVMTLTAIAIIRWYVITRSVHGYHGINTHRSMITVAIITWIASFIAMVTPPSLGIGSVGYSEFYRLCSVTDDNPLRAFYVLIQAIILVLALFVTAVFYILILHFVMKSTKSFRTKFREDEAPKGTKENQSNTTGNGMSTNARFNKREIEITKNLFVVVCVFVLCMSPQGVNFIIPGASIFTLYSGAIMSFNSTLNPIIYGLKHPNFKEVFRFLLTCNVSGISQPVNKAKAKNDTRSTSLTTNKPN